MSDTRSNEPPQYHRIETSVRPVRVAGLIADLDDWISPAQRMIELFSRTWGGSGNVLFAYAENSPIPASQWRLLERYDPDRLGYYVPTYRGLRMAAPDKFEEWLERQARRWADESDVTSYDEARQQLLESHLDSPRTSWRPPDEFVDGVRRRLAPLDPNDPFDHGWSADGSSSGQVQ